MKRGSPTTEVDENRRLQTPKTEDRQRSFGLHQREEDKCDRRDRRLRKKSDRREQKSSPRTEGRQEQRGSPGTEKALIELNLELSREKICRDC